MTGDGNQKYLTVLDMELVANLGLLKVVDPVLFSEFEKLASYFDKRSKELIGWEEIGQVGMEWLGKWRGDLLGCIENGSKLKKN